MKALKKVSLKLEKEVIASLSNGELQQINGGSYDTQKESKAPKCDTNLDCINKTTVSLNCWESNSLCPPKISDNCVNYTKAICEIGPISGNCHPVSQICYTETLAINCNL